MAPVRLVILIPILDDWRALALLVPRIAAAVKERSGGVGLLVVDDGSITSAAEIAPNLSAGGLEWVRVLRLKRNLGHQRAIAVGLCYIEAHVPCEQVVVMDGDGEDRPEDLPQLLARAAAEHGRQIVFAERQRRVEGVAFRTGYSIYRLLHRLLTGRGVSFGNFSVIPRSRLESLTIVSELWIHYAAAVVRSRHDPPRKFSTPER